MKEGVITIQLVDLSPVSDIGQASKTKQLLESNKLFVYFLNNDCYSDLLTLEKKGYLDSQMMLTEEEDEANNKNDLIVSFESERGLFKGYLSAESLLQVDVSTEKEFDIDLKDLAEVPQFKAKLRIRLDLSKVEKSLLGATGEALVKESTVTNYLMQLSNLEVDNGFIVAQRKRTVQESDAQKSEIFLVVELGKQIVEIDIEDPKA